MPLLVLANIVPVRLAQYAAELAADGIDITFVTSQPGAYPIDAAPYLRVFEGYRGRAALALSLRTGEPTPTAVAMRREAGELPPVKHGTFGEPGFVPLDTHAFDAAVGRFSARAFVPPTARTRDDSRGRLRHRRSDGGRRV